MNDAPLTEGWDQIKAKWGSQGAKFKEVLPPCIGVSVRPSLGPSASLIMCPGTALISPFAWPSWKGENWSFFTSESSLSDGHMSENLSALSLALSSPNAFNLLHSNVWLEFNTIALISPYLLSQIYGEWY